MKRELKVERHLARSPRVGRDTEPFPMKRELKGMATFWESSNVLVIQNLEKDCLAPAALPEALDSSHVR